MSEQTYRNPLFGQRVDRYIPPELRQGLGAVLALGDMLNPVSAYREYLKAVNEGDYTDAAVEAAGIFAPGVAGKLVKPAVRAAGPYIDDATKAMMEVFLPTGAPDVAPRMVGGVEDFGRGLGSVRMPAAEASQRTQIAGTFPTYEKAVKVFDEVAPEGRSLDYGAGLGKSSELGFDTFEPFAREGFDPTYRVSSDIPDASYERVTNLNVLNVLDPETRRNVVLDIGRVLKPEGVAVITTRGRDVLTAKGERGPEDMSVITTAGTYQKGFTKPELVSYLRDTLGDGFEVKSLNLGPAGALVRKLPVGRPEGAKVKPVLGEAFDDWIDRIYAPENRGKGNVVQDENVVFRAMSPKEAEVGEETGVFRDMTGQPLYVANDPERYIGGGAYGGKRQGRIYEFDVTGIPSRVRQGGVGIQERAIDEIPSGRVRRVWEWNPDTKAHELIVDNTRRSSRPD